MPSCEVCRGLAKQVGRARLFLEFTPTELLHSALNHECRTCGILLNGIKAVQDGGSWSFESDISRVYGYALARKQDTLTLEMYFSDGRPSMAVEFFRECGVDGTQSSIATTPAA
jgi:hypothetical protein